MIENVKGALPSTMKHMKSKKDDTRMELSSESWSKLKQAAHDPIVFLTHPRNLVKYMPSR